MDQQQAAQISVIFASLGIAPSSIAAIALDADVSPAEVEESSELIAFILNEIGWVYHPEHPKSRCARHGNYAHQTTWFTGYWFNYKTLRVSYVQPSRMNEFRGDDLLMRRGSGRWRTGGAPWWKDNFTDVERLCAHIEEQGYFQFDKGPQS